MKLRTITLSILVLGSLIAAVAPIAAHHSFAAEFDSAKPITLRGYVTKIEWTNPHVWIFLDVKDDTGKKTNWGFEMGPPHLLQGSGWNREKLNLQRGESAANRAECGVRVSRTTPPIPASRCLS